MATVIGSTGASPASYGDPERQIRIAEPLVGDEFDPAVVRDRRGPGARGAQPSCR